MATEVKKDFDQHYQNSAGENNPWLESNIQVWMYKEEALDVEGERYSIASHKKKIGCRPTKET